MNPPRKLVHVEDPSLERRLRLLRDQGGVHGGGARAEAKQEPRQ